jgi:hypothetical protein
MSNPTVETLKFQHVGVSYVATYDSRDATRLRSQLQSQSDWRINVLFRYDVQIERENGGCGSVEESTVRLIAAEFLRQMLGRLQVPQPTLH